MDYKTRKLLKQIGIIFLAAAALMVLPRVLVASVMGFIQMAISIAMIWILYRVLAPILGPIYRDYRRRHGRRPPKGRRPPQNWYSDRR